MTYLFTILSVSTFASTVEMGEDYRLDLDELSGSKDDYADA